MFGNKTAVIDENGKEYSYSFLQKEQDKLATKVSCRTLVFCLCSNEIGSLLGYTAFINNKIVPVLLDASLDRQLLYTLLNTYKPYYIWVPTSLCGEFPQFIEEHSSLDYSLLKTGFEKYPVYDELALLLTTSGSTGSPKLVRQSYKNIRANTQSIVAYLALNETERPITTMPMSYTYGLSIINSHLYVGATIIMTKRTLMEKEFWSQFNEFKATSFGGVPYVYEMLDKLKFLRMSLPHLRTMTQAGGKLNPELHRKFAEYAVEQGKKFVVMYGQTEATARMAYLPHEKSLEKYGSMGIAIPGGRFRLIDVDGNEIKEPNLVGELEYTGDNVTLGYAEKAEDLNNADEFCGTLVTGDMAKQDADGFYYIVGRKKRFLKIFGSRVNLDETERLIKSEFSDADFACAGKDDKMSVFVTDAAYTDKVLKFLTEKMGFFKSAFDIRYIQSIPRSESGKVLYNELR